MLLQLLPFRHELQQKINKIGVKKRLQCRVGAVGA